MYLRFLIFLFPPKRKSWKTNYLYKPKKEIENEKKIVIRRGQIGIGETNKL
jgi:hypothetical protein